MHICGVSGITLQSNEIKTVNNNGYPKYNIHDLAAFAMFTCTLKLYASGAVFWDDVECYGFDQYIDVAYYQLICFNFKIVSLHEPRYDRGHCNIG